MYQARGNLHSVSSLRMPQRASSQEDSVDCLPVEDSTDNVNGATLLGTGLKNEVGEYNCFLNVIIQVALLKVFHLIIILASALLFF